MQARRHNKPVQKPAQKPAPKPVVKKPEVQPPAAEPKQEPAAVVPPAKVEAQPAADGAKKQPAEFVFKFIPKARVNAHANTHGINRAVNAEITKVKEEMEKLYVYADAAKKDNLVKQLAVEGLDAAKAKQLKAELAALRSVSDQAALDALREKKDALSNCKTRFSQDANAYLASVCSAVVHEICENALNKELSTVKKLDLLDCSLSLAPLYSHLCCVRSYMKELREHERDELKDESFKRGYLEGHKVGISEARSRTKDSLGKFPHALPKQKAEAEDGDAAKKPAEEKQKGAFTFYTYINDISKNIKHEREQKGLKNGFFTKDAKHFMDTLCLELISSLSLAAKQLCAHMGVKTINKGTFAVLVSSALCHDAQSEPSFEFSNDEKTKKLKCSVVCKSEVPAWENLVNRYFDVCLKKSKGEDN